MIFLLNPFDPYEPFLYTLKKHQKALLFFDVFRG